MNKNYEDRFKNAFERTRSIRNQNTFITEDNFFKVKVSNYGNEKSISFVSSILLQFNDKKNVMDI